MTDSLISVIMSAYNESYDELRSSVESILNQTYTNIEFIIIDDNPENEELKDFLSEIDDKRVKIIYNEQNLGLVKSLNKALMEAQGEYIARMDADDISSLNRLEKQLEYIKKNNMDMIGSDLQLIDEEDAVIREKVLFPSKDCDIRKALKYGSCLPHPTWMVKKNVYTGLCGYRSIDSCEDYDFLLRVVQDKSYRLGNLPEVGLKYRIRKTGVSKKNEAAQYVLREYLSKKRHKINDLTEQDINEYKNSNVFRRKVKRYERYKRDKQLIVEEHRYLRMIFVLTNEYFYRVQREKFHNRKRYSS